MTTSASGTSLPAIERTANSEQLDVAPFDTLEVRDPTRIRNLAGAAAAAVTATLAPGAAQAEQASPTARWTVSAGPSLSIIDANNLGNSDDPGCDPARTEDCRKPGGRLVGGNNLEVGTEVEVARRSGQVEIAAALYRGCSDFHFLQANPGEGQSCATDGLARARYFTHGPDARWSGFVGATAGVSRQATRFEGHVAGRPDLPVSFGGPTWAPVYGVEVGFEGRLDARWGARLGCGWRQTGDNRLPVYVDGVRDLRPPAQPGGEPRGDQTWHRTTTGCGVRLTRTLG